MHSKLFDQLALARHSVQVSDQQNSKKMLQSETTHRLHAQRRPGHDDKDQLLRTRRLRVIAHYPRILLYTLKTMGRKEMRRQQCFATGGLEFALPREPRAQLPSSISRDTGNVSKIGAAEGGVRVIPIVSIEQIVEIRPQSHRITSVRAELRRLE